MVLLAGARQCGKTTLAQSLLDKLGQYLNWDTPGDRKIIRELAWPKDASLVVLDELHKARSIRKERRLYFLDCAAAYDETGGAQVENLVACSLLKYAHFRRDTHGENWEVFYLRDKEGREVDFVVTLNRRIQWLIEVKASDDEIGGSLRYHTARLQPKESLQLVLNLRRPQEQSGSKLLPLGAWLESLPFEA